MTLCIHDPLLVYSQERYDSLYPAMPGIKPGTPDWQAKVITTTPTQSNMRFLPSNFVAFHIFAPIFE